MKDSTPALSVIIPVHNSEKYLKRCLNSVLHQTFHDMEIIAVDNGSTDTSLEILRSFADADGRIKIISQENRGPSGARNAGLEVATGRWISFIDSDDELHLEMYETLFSHYGEEDALYFSAEEYIVKGDTLIPDHSGYFDVPFSGSVTIKEEDVAHFSKAVWDKLFLRKNIEALQLRFPEGITFEDNFFVINYFLMYHKVLFIKKKLYKYYKRQDSVTGLARSKTIGMAFNYIHILDAMYHFWKKWKLLPEKQNLFEYFIVYFFREAIQISLDWEQPGLVYALAQSLHRWAFEPKDAMLGDIKKGNLSIYTGGFPRKNILMTKTLHGLEKIFFMGNCKDKKIVCLFTIRIASWRRKKRC